MRDPKYLRWRRKQRARYSISKKNNKIRLSVFRSNKNIYAQIIDLSNNGNIIASFSSLNLTDSEKEGVNSFAVAELVGKKLAKISLEKGVKEVIFDKSGYDYHGRVKALAEGVRSEGLSC